jgi:signal recognition particle subunit SRP54
MASRILGMGDVLSFIERAEQAIDQKKAEEMAQRLMENKFTLSDYLDQLETVMGMGSLSEIASMMPGIDAKALENADPNDSVMRRTKAIIQSMTMKERENPEILNASRKRRIARGAGVSVVDVNRVLKQYETMQQMMKQMNGAGKRQMKKMNKQMKKANQKKGKKGGKNQSQQPQGLQLPKGLAGLGNLFK